MSLTLFCRHSDHVTHLEAEIVWLRGQMLHEQQRAELAIDELLRLKAGAGPVTLPTPAERREQETAAERLLRDPEFAQAGEVDG